MQSIEDFLGKLAAQQEGDGFTPCIVVKDEDTEIADAAPPPKGKGLAAAKKVSRADRRLRGSDTQKVTKRRKAA